MENLADIIKRLRDTRPVNGDSGNGFIYDEPPREDPARSAKAAGG